MAYTVIQPESVSFTSIEADILNYLDSLPDSDKWTDYYNDASTGRLVIKIISALGTFLSHKALFARREVYIDQAKLASSVYKLANMLGYSPNRASGALIDITLNVTSNVYWDRDIPVGYLGGVPVSLLTSTQLSVGTQTISCIVGEWVDFDFTATSSSPFYEQAFLTGDIQVVDNDLVELTINSESVDVVKYIELLTESNVLVKTSYDRVSLMFGDGFFGRRLLNNDVVNVKYVSVSSVLDYSIDNFTVDATIGTTDSVSIVRMYQEEDSLEKIAFVAPGYFSTKRRMVSKDDHIYIFRSYSGMASAQIYVPDDEFATVYMSYLYTDEHIMLEPEQEVFLEFLEDYKVVGEQIKFTDPESVDIDVELRVVVEGNIDTDAITTSITEYIESYALILEGSYFPNDIYTYTAAISGVLRVYIISTSPSVDTQLEYNQYFRLNSLNVTYTTDATSTFT